MAGVDISRDADDEFAIGAALIEEVADAANPIGHDLAAVGYLGGMEVRGLIVELELEAVDGITMDRLLNESQAFVADLGMLEVEA